MLKLSARHLTSIEQQKILQQKLAWILSVCVPLKIILFGSAASGDMREHSDVDLVLIFSDQEAVKSAKMTLNRTRPKDDWQHDLLFYTNESFLKSVDKGGGAAWVAMKEGKVIFEDGEVKL